MYIRNRDMNINRLNAIKNKLKRNIFIHNQLIIKSPSIKDQFINNLSIKDPFNKNQNTKDPFIRNPNTIGPSINKLSLKDQFIKYYPLLLLISTHILQKVSTINNVKGIQMENHSSIKLKRLKDSLTLKTS